jgi:hypothetical protein
MQQSKTYFEQIPVETVKKIATELPETNATETGRFGFEMQDKAASSQEDWRHLAQRIQEEQDPRKMLELVQQLLDALEDRKTLKPQPAHSANL